MNLISLIIIIVIMGLVLWIINTQMPMPPLFKTVVNVLVALFVIVWLLQLAGFSGPNLRLK